MSSARNAWIWSRASGTWLFAMSKNARIICSFSITESPPPWYAGNWVLRAPLLGAGILLRLRAKKSCARIAVRGEVPFESSQICSRLHLVPEINEAVDRVVVEARTVREEELPHLVEILDREDALPLPLRAKEEVPVQELLEMI